MKKIIVTLLTAAMLTATFAGCNGNTNSSNTSSNSSENSGNTDISAPVADAKAPVERLNAVFSQFSVFNNMEECIGMVVAGPDVDKIKEVFPDPADPEKPTHCVVMVEDTSAGESPLVSMFGLTQVDLADCEDYVIAAPMISAALKKIVIVKPAAGKEETVKNGLMAFADAEKEFNPMEYPAWEAERAGTKFGETADGLYYVVIAEEGADMGAAIENA